MSCTWIDTDPKDFVGVGHLLQKVLIYLFFKAFVISSFSIPPPTPFFWGFQEISVCLLGF